MAPVQVESGPRRPSLAESERVELEYWTTSPTEKPGVWTLENLINKLGDCPVLLERLAPYAPEFRAASAILELGGGQGWAAGIVKSRFAPRAQVFVSDLSPASLTAVPNWERLLEVEIDGRFASRSYELPLPDASFDIVFAFASAHHFRAHRRTLREAYRVLAPGGSCFYFHEPSCPRWIYPLAYRRLNATRPAVHEDVLVTGNILRIAREMGFEPSAVCDLSITKRRPVELLYYFLLMRRVPVLRRLLPCTRDFVFRKT